MLTQDQIEALRAEHKRVAHVVGKKVDGSKEPPWEVVLRKPTRAEYRRFRAMATSDGKANAQEWLAIACVVHPSREAFDAVLDDYPAAADACASAMMDICGLAVEDEGKS